MKTCPFCKKEVLALGKHLLHCKEIPQNLTKDEIKFKGIESYAGKGFLEELINDYNNLYSLTDLREKYNIDFKNILWCLKYANIPLRTMSESQKKITIVKARETLKKQYGDNIINVAQLPETKEKVKKTFIEHYGVDNIWKTKEYAEFTSKRWASYTPEYKQELLKKWTHQPERISKLENEIINILNILHIPLETQFKFDDYYHKYDIYLKDTNILIEVNGDFWHANPKIYKSTDKLNFPNNLIKYAEDIWKKDKMNILYAEQKNYKVIQLWESDINEAKKKKVLETYILKNINPYLIQLNNTKN